MQLLQTNDNRKPLVSIHWVNPNYQNIDPLQETQRPQIILSNGKRKYVVYLIPRDHICLFNPVSTRTSGVPIVFSANFRISLIARGARFLKPLKL